MTETTEHYILIPVWMTLTSFKVTVVWEMKNFCLILSQISEWILMKYIVLLQPVGLLKLMPCLIDVVNSQER